MRNKPNQKFEQPNFEAGKNPEPIDIAKKSPIERKQELMARINDGLSVLPELNENIGSIRAEKEKEAILQIKSIEADLGKSLSEESKKQIMRNNVDMTIEGISKGQEKREQLEKQKSILEYVEKELPESETRITEPMHQDCRVAVSVPAYEEGGKILNLLEFLANQKDVSVDEYEIIVNVNNREGAKKNTRNLNTQTLNILRFMKGESADLDFLSTKEKERLQKLKKNGLAVHYIDKSSEGSETKPIDDNDFRRTGCMQPRKRTMDEICERFVLAGKADGIIASLDADTKVNPRWIREIIDAFENESVQLLAGERRDGLDISLEGEQIDNDRVMERLFDDWNSEDRRKEEAFKKLPDIENRTQRAQIILMKHLIGAYNTARSQFRREMEGKTGTIENFKGGSGKMFRVGTYIRSPLEIIKIMDAGGKKPADISENSFQYIGRNKSEKVEPTTQNPQVEALAVYPETRVRGWDVESENEDGPYKDFNDTHKPFGSSGKEHAYAISAVLKEKIPTTYNEEVGEMRTALENFITSGQTKEARQKLEMFFDQKTIEQITEITSKDLEKLKIGDQSTIDKYKSVIDKFKMFSEKPVSVIDALRFYGSKNPSEQIFNPERYFFSILVKQIMMSKEREKEQLKKYLKDSYYLNNELVDQLSKLKNQEELSQFSQNNPEIQQILSTMPEKVSYNEAAEKYEKLVKF
jgi:hypothetical protein